VTLKQALMAKAIFAQAGDKNSQAGLQDRVCTMGRWVIYYYNHVVQRPLNKEIEALGCV